MLTRKDKSSGMACCQHAAQYVPRATRSRAIRRWIVEQRKAQKLSKQFSVSQG